MPTTATCLFLSYILGNSVLLCFSLKSLFSVSTIKCPLMLLGSLLNDQTSAGALEK